MDSLDVETQHYLQKAYEDVVTEADKIRIPQFRASFLENVRVNRAIVAEFRGSGTI